MYKATPNGRNTYPPVLYILYALSLSAIHLHAVYVPTNHAGEEFTVTNIADVAIFKHLGFTAASHTYAHLVFDFKVFNIYEQLKTLCSSTQATLPDLQKVREEKILFNNQPSKEKSHAEKMIDQFIENEIHASGNSPVEYHVHKLRKVLLDDCLNTQTNFENVIETLTSGTTNVTRNKRQAAMYVTSFIAGNVAASSDLFSLTGLLGISNTASSNTSPQTIQLLSEHETRITVNERSIEILNDTLKNLIAYTDQIQQSQVIHAGLSVGLAEYRRLMFGLIDTIDQRLSPHLIRSSALKATILKLKAKLAYQGLELKFTLLQDMFHLPTSHLLINNTLRILVHIPVVKTESVMTIYQFVPLPIKIYDTFYEIHPIKNILAIEPVHNKIFKELDKEELDSCFMHLTAKYCKNANIYQTKKEYSCLLAIKENVPELIKKNCEVKPFKEEEKLVQIDEKTFIVYLPERTKIHIICENKKYMQAHVGLIKLNINGKCTVNLDRHSFETTPEIYTPPTNIEHEVTMLHSIFEEEEEKVSVYLNEKLARVGSLTGLKLKDIPKLLHNPTHIIAGSTTSIITLLIIGAIAFYCYKKRCAKEMEEKPNQQQFNFTVERHEHKELEHVEMEEEPLKVPTA